MHLGLCRCNRRKDRPSKLELKDGRMNAKVCSYRCSLLRWRMFKRGTRQNMTFSRLISRHLCCLLLVFYPACIWRWKNLVYFGCDRSKEPLPQAQTCTVNSAGLTTQIWICLFLLITQQHSDNLWSWQSRKLLVPNWWCETWEGLLLWLQSWRYGYPRRKRRSASCLRMKSWAFQPKMTKRPNSWLSHKRTFLHFSLISTGRILIR